MARFRTTLLERLFIQSDLLARLKCGPLGFAALCRIGTPEQTLRELAVIVEAGLVCYDERRDRYCYLGLDQKVKTSPRTALAETLIPAPGRGRERT
jgi:hypothetical protein